MAKVRIALGDRVASGVVWMAVFLVSAAFFWMLTDIVRHGAGQITWTFLTGPVRDAGRAGGIGPVLASTALILTVCMGVSLPLGVGAAVFLSEMTTEESVPGRLVRRSLDVLAGIPSIVFGLFGNAFFCKVLGMGFSILSGGLTLACMVLPLLVRATEEGLRAVPRDVRLNAAALNLSRSGTLSRLILPAAAPGLVVGLVLGMGRAVAETAALIFTSGYVDRLPESVMDSGRALSVHIFELSMNVPGGNPNAYGAALVLIAFLLVINGAASLMAEKWLHRRIVT